MILIYVFDKYIDIEYTKTKRKTVCLRTAASTAISVAAIC